jgi:hypothetical protein
VLRRKLTGFSPKTIDRAGALVFPQARPTVRALLARDQPERDLPFPMPGFRTTTTTKTTCRTKTGATA